MKGYAGDIAGVAIEGEERVGICRADVIQFDIVVAGSGKVALVRGDAETVDLGVWVLDGPGADAREGFPEADGVVITGCNDLRRCRV